MSRTNDLLEDIRNRHPRSLPGVEEARAVDPERFDQVAEQFLGWGQRAGGRTKLADMVDAFAQFSNDVAYAQAHYEARGEYENQSFEEVNQAVYSQREVMDDYLWGVYLTNFLWAHHLEITLFFRDRFLPRIPEAGRILEFAPGHGGWGLSALAALPEASLCAYDISPSSIAIASAISEAAGMSQRASYTEQNALDPKGIESEAFEAGICCFLLEHLEQPGQLVAQMARALRPGHAAFLTGGLTAAQIDHIYEFKRESELVTLCENEGLRVLETFSANPRRQLPKARYIPRSMALIVEKPKGL